MMTLDEIYGGQLEFVYETPDEVFEVADYADYRVLSLGSDDVASGTFVCRLPTPTTVRQTGWLYLCVNNDTDRPIDIEDKVGNFLGFLDANEAMLIGLADPNIPAGGGTWVLQKKARIYAVGTRMSETHNMGSTTGLENDVDVYSYTADSWTSLPGVLPIDGGTGSRIGATDVTGSTFNSLDVYYGQGSFFYSFNTFAVPKAAPGFPFSKTGLSNIQGSPIGDMMHIQNNEFVVTRATEAYGVSGDAWTVGPDFPTLSGIDAPEETVNRSIGFDVVNRWAFISPSTPDSAAIFMAYEKFLQVYLLAAYPPYPRGPFRPSCVGIGQRFHFQGGSYSENSGVSNSTDTHYEFNPFTNIWLTLPRIPVYGRGLGCRGFNNPRDRYTFGMGETTSTPSEVHFEYNITTRAYTARATFTWGTARAGQEIAWASQN